MASKVQDCDCGFIDSKDPTGSIFTSFLAVNFSSISTSDFNNLFIPATYTVTQDGSPYTRNFSASQVELSSSGLDLTVSPSTDGKGVPCGQIFSRAATYFYGSYHASFRTGDVPGTVTAFFNYKNDSSEVDIEYLSSWAIPTLLYTTKPQIYDSSGNPSNLTYQKDPWNDTSSTFDENYHEWSYVWLPNIVHYGLDADYSKFITTNVPQAPGRLALSHWSDGNPNYSLGPPTEDSIIYIASLWAVYNDTNASALSCTKASSACNITEGIFQATTTSSSSSSSSGGNSATIMPSTQIINSSHSLSPAAPGWLFLLILFWSRVWC